jgi:hypothetical protein
LPKKTPRAKRDVTSAGELQPDVHFGRPFQTRRLADRVVDRRVQDHDTRKPLLDPLGKEEIALNGQALLGLITNELAHAAGTIFLEDLPLEVRANGREVLHPEKLEPTTLKLRAARFPLLRRLDGQMGVVVQKARQPGRLFRQGVGRPLDLVEP